MRDILKLVTVGLGSIIVPVLLVMWAQMEATAQIPCDRYDVIREDLRVNADMYEAAGAIQYNSVGNAALVFFRSDAGLWSVVSFENGTNLNCAKIIASGEQWVEFRR